MQGDMSNQIAPSVLLEVKARRAFALVQREQPPPAVKINARVIELYCPNMDGPFKRRKFGRRCRPGRHKPRGRGFKPALILFVNVVLLSI